MPTDLTTHPASPVEKDRLVTRSVVVCLLGIGVALVGAFLPLWRINNTFARGFPELPVTWWGVIDHDPRVGVHVTSVVIEALPAILAIVAAAVTLSSPSRRSWFGLTVGGAAGIWLLALIVMYAVYEDRAAAVDFHEGTLLILCGLVACIRGAIADATKQA